MKVLIYLVVGLAVGLGGGTAWKALQVKSEVEASMLAAADSARADSLAVAGAADDHAEGPADDADHGGDPSAADPAGPGEGEPEVDDPEEAVDVQLARADGEEEDAGAAPADSTAADGADPPGGDVPTDEGPAEEGDAGPDAGEAGEAEGPAVTDEGARRLARVFGAMRAADAARVLAELSNPEVEAILIKLGDRQAGQILSSFPPDRAANLSRRVLGRNGGDV